MKNHNILVVIPARGGSVAVPRKNIRNLNGHPLISYAIKAALNCIIELDIIVSTDDQEIAEVAISCGVEVPFIRPKEISNSNSSLAQVSKHALDFYQGNGKFYDAVMSIQPTSPFITSKTIQKVIEIYEQKSCSSVSTISEMHFGHPYTAKKISEDGDITNFSHIPEGAITAPRQKREPAYVPNGALYLRSKEAFTDSNSDRWQLGATPKAVIMSEYESVDINTEFDFKYAEFLIKTLNE